MYEKQYCDVRFTLSDEKKPMGYLDVRKTTLDVKEIIPKCTIPAFGWRAPDYRGRLNAFRWMQNYSCIVYNLEISLINRSVSTSTQFLPLYLKAIRKGPTLFECTEKSLFKILFDAVCEDIEQVSTTLRIDSENPKSTMLPETRDS